MGTEIEKKYRLTREQRAELLRRLRKIGAVLEGEEFEENTIYGGPPLYPRRRGLRPRPAGGDSLLTYKKRVPPPSAPHHHPEDEPRGGAGSALLDNLGAPGV